MSEVERSFLEEYDKRYSQMKNFLSTISAVLLSALLIVGGTYIYNFGTIKKQEDINTEAIKYIMENSASQKAIDNLIITFENQTKVMENYLPEDVQGAIKEFNKVSSNFRSYILQYQSDLTKRGNEISK